MLSCNLQKMRAVEIRMMRSGGVGKEQRTRHGHLHASCLKVFATRIKKEHAINLFFYELKKETFKLIDHIWSLTEVNDWVIKHNFHQSKTLVLVAKPSTDDTQVIILCRMGWRRAENGMRTHSSWESDQRDHEDDHPTHQAEDVDIVDLQHIRQVACTREVENITRNHAAITAHPITHAILKLVDHLYCQVLQSHSHYVCTSTA